jgi:signal peptidase I
MRQLAGRTITALACLVAVVAAATVVGQLSGRIRLMPVLSGSMTPTYSTGSAALVTPEPASALRVGQVVVYHIPVLDHHLVMHRVVRVRMAGSRPVITTRGDANPAVDPWRARLANRTVWVAREDLPWAGYVIVALRSPVTIVGVVLLLGAIAVAKIALREWRRRENDVWWQT